MQSPGCRHKLPIRQPADHLKWSAISSKIELEIGAKKWTWLRRFFEDFFAKPVPGESPQDLGSLLPGHKRCVNVNTRCDHFAKLGPVSHARWRSGRFNEAQVVSRKAFTTRRPLRHGYSPIGEVVEVLRIHVEDGQLPPGPPAIFNGL
jgi:hypothetical protein